MKEDESCLLKVQKNKRLLVAMPANPCQLSSTLLTIFIGS